MILLRERDSHGDIHAKTLRMKSCIVNCKRTTPNAQNENYNPPAPLKGVKTRKGEKSG
jgi:hypothetical protein